jgi:hypothetical protein
MEEKMKRKFIWSSLSLLLAAAMLLASCGYNNFDYDTCNNNIRCSHHHNSRRGDCLDRD